MNILKWIRDLQVDQLQHGLVCSTIYEDIKKFSELNYNFRDTNKSAKDLAICQDRNIWRDIVKRIMLHRATNML
jgi:hypothetical protein